MEQFAAIIESIEQGESVRSICDRPGWPTRNEFRKAIAADRALWVRYREAMTASVPRRKARLFERMAKAWSGRRQQCVEIRAAKSPRTTPKRRCARPQLISPAVLGGIISDVAGGALLRDACRKRKVAVPAFQFRVLNNPSLRTCWFDAKNDGAAVRLARGTLRHVDRILTLIEGGLSLQAALASDVAFPCKSKFLNALDTDADLRWRYDEAIAKNRDDRARRARRRRLRLSSLTGLDLAEQADMALPKHTDPDIRTEVVAEVVAAALCGDISHRVVQQEARRLARRATSEMFYPKHASLDMPLSPDSSATFGDLLSNWD